MEAKTKKIILWVTIGTLTAAAIGVGAYFIWKSLSKPVTSTGLTTQIKFATNENSKARVKQYNVGQADCALIQISQDGDFSTTKDNFNILVDVGVENNSSNAVKKELTDKIYNDFVRNIDFFVFSHLHYDHIGAASTLLNDNRFTFKDTTALFNWSEAKYFGDKLTATAKKLFKELEDKKIQLADSNYWASKDSGDNRIIDFGDNNYFSVIGGLDVANIPELSDKENNKNGKNQNAWSVVNRFQWKDQSILYSGDLAGALRSDGVSYTIPKKHYKELDCDILKAPHHGSGTEESNGLDFLKKVSAQEVWISAGHSDKYTLPDVTPLNNFLASGISEENIKGTDYFGNKESKEQEKWKALDDWIKQHPKANNANQGWGDILKEFN